MKRLEKLYIAIMAILFAIGMTVIFSFGGGGSGIGEKTPV